MDKTIAKYEKLCKEKQVEYDELSKQKGLCTIYLASPLVTYTYIALDGILAYFSLLEICGQDFYNLSKDTILNSPLPLEKCKTSHGLEWWTCSFGACRINYEYITKWQKRWDNEHEDLVQFKAKCRIDHKSGYFKAYSMPLILKLTNRIEFCFLGNLEEVKHLLKNVVSIGKKRSQGYGQVKKITVKATSKDWYCWDEQKRATRSIPIDPKDLQNIIATQGEKFFRGIFQGYKPPYWSPKNQAMCYPVTTKHELS